MANKDIVNGFRPLRRLSGGTTWPINRYYIDSSNAVAAVGIGTMMTLAANTSSVGVPEVAILATQGSVVAPLGPVVAIEFNPDAPNRLYLPASTSGYVYIADAPDMVLAVQSSGTFEDGDIGAKADLTDAGTSTTTGMSGQEIDQSDIGATLTFPFTIYKLLNRADNALGANAELEVIYNLHVYAPSGYVTGNAAGVHN
jgi:hypothetical protein